MSFFSVALAELFEKVSRYTVMSRKYRALADLKRAREHGYVGRREEMVTALETGTVRSDEYRIVTTPTGFVGVSAYGVVLEVPSPNGVLPRGAGVKRVKDFRTNIVLESRSLNYATDQFIRQMVSVLRGISEERARR